MKYEFPSISFPHFRMVIQLCVWNTHHINYDRVLTSFGFCSFLFSFVVYSLLLARYLFIYFLYCLQFTYLVLGMNLISVIPITDNSLWLFGREAPCTLSESVRLWLMRAHRGTITGAGEKHCNLAGEYWLTFFTPLTNELHQQRTTAFINACPRLGSPPSSQRKITSFC